MTERYPGGKHYLTYDTAMKQRFGKKIIKLSLNAGFTCPNRDGSKGTGGCIFCTSSGSGDFSGNAMDSISVQLQKEAERMRSKWPEHSAYIAYFQANTCLLYTSFCAALIMSSRVTAAISVSCSSGVEYVPQRI